MKVLTNRQILLLHSALIRQSGGSDGLQNESLLATANSPPFQPIRNSTPLCWRRPPGWGLE